MGNAPSTPGALPAPAMDGLSSEAEEQLLLTLQTAYVYKVGSRPSAAGHRAEAWQLDAPAATGYLRLTSWVQGDTAKVAVAVWQRSEAAAPAAASPAPSGGTAAALAPVTLAPRSQGHKLIVLCVVPISIGQEGEDVEGGSGVTRFVEPVVDSSRYFVLRLESSSGSVGYCGLGFHERNDAFAFKSALSDFVAQLSRQRTGLSKVLASAPDIVSSPQPQPLAAATAATATDSRSNEHGGAGSDAGNAAAGATSPPKQTGAPAPAPAAAASASVWKLAPPRGFEAAASAPAPAQAAAAPTVPAAHDAAAPPPAPAPAPAAAATAAAAEADDDFADFESAAAAPPSASAPPT